MIVYDGSFKRCKANDGLLDDFLASENDKENQQDKLQISVNAPRTIDMYVGSEVEIEVFFNGDELNIKEVGDLGLLKFNNITLG